MHYWLLKTEPGDFSWQEQVRKGAKGETWDGVRNHQAANFLRQMQVDDRAFFYHSGKERRIVGTVAVIRANFPDPGDPSGRFVAVTVRALEALARPVTLAGIKTDAAFDEFLLVRNSRLSVMPVPAALWKKIMTMAGA